MKNIATLIIAVLISTATVKAYVWTVSNNAFSPGHFTNLQIAIDSANTCQKTFVLWGMGAILMRLGRKGIAR